MRLRAGVAIDLGTVNTLVSVTGRGLVVEEPSAIAIHRATGTVAAVGGAADALAGKDPLDLEVVHPLRDGVIADLEAATAMLQAFLRQARVHRRLLRPAAVVCVPSGATEVERRSLVAAVAAPRPRCLVRLIDEPVAAAAGAGFDLADGTGAFIVDIGGGTTEAAVVAGGHLVRAQSLRLGGNTMDEAIVHAVRNEFGLLLGRNAARNLKMTLGLAEGVSAAGWMEVVGIDAARRTPRVEDVPSRSSPMRLSIRWRRSSARYRRCCRTSRRTWPKTWCGARSGWPAAAPCCPAWPTGSRRPAASRPSWSTIRCGAWFAAPPRSSNTATRSAGPGRLKTSRPYCVCAGAGRRLAKVPQLDVHPGRWCRPGHR